MANKPLNSCSKAYFFTSLFTVVTTPGSVEPGVVTTVKREVKKLKKKTS